MIKFLSLALTLCAFAGFNYGLFRFFIKKRALFCRMIIFGIGCAMFGRLFITLRLFITGELPNGFHVGILGITGSFLFFFTANYGQMDSLVDDRSVRFRKYRLIALLGPAVIIALYFVYLHFAGFGLSSIVYGVVTLIIVQAAYFHVKHIIIPDVDYGIIRCLRAYNILALIYAVLIMLEMILSIVPFSGGFALAIYIPLCIVMLLFTPVLEKGVDQWTI